MLVSLLTTVPASARVTSVDASAILASRPADSRLGLNVEIVYYTYCFSLREPRLASGKSVVGLRLASDPSLRWKGRPLQHFGGTEVYDMRARQWVPEMGSFLSIDELAYHDPKSTLWGWPGQNPIRYVDPSGRYAAPVLFAGVVLAALYFSVATPTHDGSVVQGAAIMAAPAVGVELGAELAALTVPSVGVVETAGGGKLATDALDRSSRDSLNSLASRLAEHEAKLNAYRANPDAFDNKGYLANAPTPEIREQIIRRRIEILERDIQNFENQIAKIKNSCE